MRVKTVRF